MIPVYNDLTLEALNNSVENTFNNNKVKVFRPEYLLAIALQTGRTQDLIKVELLMKEAEEFNKKLFQSKEETRKIWAKQLN